MILLFSFFISAQTNSAFYDNEYKGVATGKSTLADVIGIFGKPSNKKLYCSVVKYYFDESDKVNKIVLTNEFAIKPKYQEFWGQLLQKIKNRIFGDPNTPPNLSCPRWHSRDYEKKYEGYRKLSSRS